VKARELKVLSASSVQVSEARFNRASAPHDGAFLYIRPCSLGNDWTASRRVLM
jgi:hypothetical protein